MDTVYDEKFMRRAIELARECAVWDEVPVGAVIVKGGEIVAEGQNRKERALCAVRHAEIEAIEHAAERLGNWWLEDCDLYVTLEPCAMCTGAAVNSRLRRIVFGAFDDKTGACGSRVCLTQAGLFNHDIEVVGGVLKEECAGLLSEFFAAKRRNKKQQ